MILIYFDESGINYSARDGLFNDGPFLIMGAMCVYEDVYWSMERLFCQLIDDYFGINNWLKQEIHATDIWFGNALSKNLKVDKRREFFDEFLQLCGKFGLPYVFSFNLKYTKQDIKEKNLNMLRTASCLLISLEHNLAEMHQTGVLIADASNGSEQLQTKDIVIIDIQNKSLSPAQALLKQFYEMTSWRTTKTNRDSFTIKPKYPTEVRSAYLIDRVHFLPSNDSLFLKMCDIITFIIQRALVHDYLLVANKSRIIQDKIPFTKSGLAMIKNKIYPSCYELKEDDVMFYQDVGDGEGFLIDFPPEDYAKIKDHYNQMQETS